MKEQLTMVQRQNIQQFSKTLDLSSIDEKLMQKCIQIASDKKVCKIFWAKKEVMWKQSKYFIYFYAAARLLLTARNLVSIARPSVNLKTIKQLSWINCLLNSSNCKNTDNKSCVKKGNNYTVKFIQQSIN